VVLIASGQSGVLQTLERNHSAMQTEVLELRQKKKEAEAAERVHKDVERALRDDIRALQDQLERSRRDMEYALAVFNNKVVTDAIAIAPSLRHSPMLPHHHLASPTYKHASRPSQRY
jgi:hypothetical protein